MEKAIKHWVLLRGLARESRHWGRFLTVLQKAFPKCTLHPLDLKGAGIHHEETSPLCVPDYVPCLQAEVDERVPSEEGWGLLGLSLGGMIAMEWASQKPLGLQGLAVLNSSTRKAGAFYERLQPQAYRGFWEALKSLDPYDRERKIIDLTSSTLSESEKMALAEQWAGFQRDSPLRLSNVLRQIGAAARYRGADAVNKPAVFLVGQKDKLVHPKCSFRLATEYDSPIRSYGAAGHDLTLDAPEWVATQLQQWSDHLK